MTRTIRETAAKKAAALDKYRAQYSPTAAGLAGRPLHRCEGCGTVAVVSRYCVGCMEFGTMHALTADEAAAYVERGHEAFSDTQAIRDERGGVVRYERA